MNIYKNTFDDLFLNEAAKLRLLNNIRTELSKEKAASFPSVTHIKSFPHIKSVAAVAMSAVVLCAVAVPTALYLAGDSVKPPKTTVIPPNTTIPPDITITDSSVLGGYISYKYFEGEASEEVPPSHYRCGYCFETNEYDIDKVEVTLFYGIDKYEFDWQYNIVDTSETEIYGNIVEISDITVSLHGLDVSADKTFNSVPVGGVANGVYIIDRIMIDCYDDIPFDDYALTVRYIPDEDPDIDCGDSTVEVTYAYSCKIIIPQEMFSDESGILRFDVASYVAFENGEKSYYGTGWPPAGFKYEVVGNRVKISAE